MSTTIPKGTLIGGKYQVTRELGRGGMASVYQAVHVDIGKRVAIKLLAGHLATSQTVVERFLREARAVAQIRSPHICDVYDSGRFEDGAPYLVLELLEGESLYDAMCRDRQMSPAVTLAIILQVARGLERAHGASIVHRDLKPENIFLTVDEDGHLRVKILDFGLAKFYDPVSVATGGKSARLTREGAVFGTPAYMSPEQVRGQAGADTRADLWALACITYECLTGTTVWSTDEGVAMTFAQIATAPIPDPRKYRPDLPVAFSEWFRTALDRNLNERYQHVQQFADSLVAVFDYRAERGGLDAALVNRITHEAANAPDAQAITARMRHAAVKAREQSAEPLLAMRPEAGGPSSASPSAVELQQSESLLVPTAPAGGRRINLKIVGGAVAMLTVVVIVIVAGSVDEVSAPPELKRFGGVAAGLAKTKPEHKSGFRYVAKHPWLPLVREAQALVAQGEHERAITILRRVYAQHRHGLIRNLMNQLEVAVAAKKSQARCQVTGYARPRRYDLLSQDRKAVDATAPGVALSLSGALMTWADNRDGGGRRAYAARLDEALRNEGLPVDITPEGAQVFTPRLLPVAQRYLVAYWDMSGSAAGVYLRWLGADGVIAAPPVPVGPTTAGAYFASAARYGDDFIVAWAERRGADSVDLFYRRFDKEGKALGGPVRATDYRGRGAAKALVREVRVSSSGGKLYFAYGFLRGALQQIRLLAVDAGTKPPGLEPLGKGDRLESRVLGHELDLTPRTQKGTKPSLACTPAGCFVAWNQALKGGASVAFIDAKTGRRRWHKRFTTKGKYPAVGVAPSGEAELVWYQGGRVTVASLGREGVGPSSKIGRVVGRQPPASVAPGAKRGEWYVSWLDFESGHREPYAARIACQ